MSKRLADRLTAARQDRFVGRAAERLVFEQALRAAEPAFSVLHVYGPGGVGKTALLREFEASCRTEGIAAASVDGRNVAPEPAGFTEAVAAAFRLPPGAPPLDALAARATRHVLFVDTYELLAPLDGWLRDVFLPELPEHVLVVLAGRNAPTPPWRIDAGWQSLLRAMPLDNLSPEEGRHYLAGRRIPPDRHPAVLAFTHGHPLALSLVADVLAQRPGQPFAPEHAPDVIKTLLDRFLEDVPSPQHRAALEACALLRVTTESMLAEMVDVSDAHDVFEWLRTLSFIETGPLGLFPHDLVRDALSADIRWRHPARYAALHQRARANYVRRLGETRGRAQERILSEYAYLHRDNPAIRPFLAWQGGGGLPDAATEADRPALVELVARHEGSEAARLAGYWLGRPSAQALVFRDAPRPPLGLLLALRLDEVTAGDLNVDPAVRTACAYLQTHAPLRRGERATYFRFWLARDTYQGVSPTQSLIFLKMTQHYLTAPDLAFTFVPFADAPFWVPFCAYIDLFPVPDADFETEGRTFRVYGHDWRTVPPVAWLGTLADREVLKEPASAPSTPPETPVRILGEQAFEAAVRQALRRYARPDRMSGLSLLQTRLVVDRAGPEADEAERIGVLRALLREAVASLEVQPREARYVRVLDRTYLHPRRSQEQAAEQLGLPFSTYRRHLKAGLRHVVAWLWLRETGAAPFVDEHP